MRLAYLVGQYPTLSHTYILREIERLRVLGAEIDTISISDPDRPFSELPPDEQAEASRTFYVKANGAGPAVLAHFRTLLRSPIRYAAGFLDATRFGGWNPRTLLAHYFYFAEAIVVGDWLRARKHSHVHTHFSTTVALFIARVFPVEVSATIHGSGEFREATAFHLRQKIVRFAFIRAISRFGRSQMMLESPTSAWDKIEVVPLGVDPALYAPRPFEERPKPFRLICVGLLAAVKGYPVLFAALDRLVREGRDVTLRLVGDGPDRVELEGIAAARGLGERITFAGWRTQAEVRSDYQSADVFALASFAEGIPVVLMEAMSMGIPCVASRITGIPEIIEDGVSGLLVTPSDDEGLALAIGQLMDDSAFRRRVGNAARAKIEREYDIVPNGVRLHALFAKRITPAAR